MNIFERNNKPAIKQTVKDAAEVINEEVEQVETPVEEPVETTEKVVETNEQVVVTEPVEEQKFHKYRVKFNGKKYRVVAKSEIEAYEKIQKFFENKIIEPAKELKEEDKQIIIKVKDIFNAIAGEITRIVTVAHPETVDNTYDRWVAVLTEELGEIVHEINDAYEGKQPTKNTYVECVQLAAATILLAKKFANEHPEMFSEEDK